METEELSLVLAAVPEAVLTLPENPSTAITRSKRRLNFKLATNHPSQTTTSPPTNRLMAHRLMAHPKRLNISKCHKDTNLTSLTKASTDSHKAVRHNNNE